MLLRDAAATWVRRCRRPPSRSWLARCALVSSASGSGKPMSANSLPLPRVTFVSVSRRLVLVHRPLSLAAAGR